MKIIAHRGNMDGPETVENDPQRLPFGEEVELDVWSMFGHAMLGHDHPKYDVKQEVLMRKGVWCHAKNREALIYLCEIGAHYFWHEHDQFAITSQGYIWTGREIYNRDGTVYGICTDYGNALRGLHR